MGNFKSYNQDQPLLLPLNIKELIAEDHIVRVIDMVVEKLNLQSLYVNTNNDTGGCPAYHPRMMLKILFYAYTEGIRSSRQIARRLESDIYFMYLSGMQTPDFRTICNFRSNNLRCIKELFIQIVKLCKQLGLIRIGHVAIDGSKVRASAGRRNTKSGERLEEMQKGIEQQIKELIEEAEKIDEQEDQLYDKSNRGDEIPKELANKEILKEKIEQAKKLLEERGWKEINLTDEDSRFMKSADGSKNVSYNVQIAVDAEHQIIVASDVSSEPTDQHQLIPLYEQVVENTGEKPDEVSADCGYDSNKNYIYIEKNAINAYVPDQLSRKEIDKNGEETISQFDKRNFKYDEEKRIYICPAGKPLHHKSKHEKDGVTYHVYECTRCKRCAFKKNCTTSKFRQIIVSDADPAKEKMRQKLKTNDGKKAYSKRLYTVEPVFGSLKRTLGFTHFLLRHLQKVKTEFSLMCIAFNLKKIHLSLNRENLFEKLNISSLNKEFFNQGKKIFLNFIRNICTRSYDKIIFQKQALLLQF